MKLPSFPSIILVWLLLATLTLHAVTFPTEWKLLPAKDTGGNWKQALVVHTVPGVVYRLQYSPSLAVPGTSDWTTVASRYGMGETWICPVLPGQAPPSETPPSGIITLPETPAIPLLQANLILGRNALGQVTLSWVSLDDHTMKQKVLSGVTLDPVWDEWENFYLQPHGGHFFAISPQLGEPSAIIASSASFGPLDEAMVAGFEANLGAMTANIAQDLAASAAYLPPVSHSGDKGFYRILADWGVDSNGGGRYDWEQLLFDGTNPYGPGGGPGGLDITTSGSGSGGYPQPGTVAPLEPLARIEQQTITFHRFSAVPKEGDPQTEVVSEEEIELSAEQYNSLAAASTFEAFKGVVDDFDMTNVPWSGDLLYNFSNTRREYTSPVNPDLTVKEFHYTRTRFRILLQGAAPPGGYQIPLRTGIVYQSIATSADKTATLTGAGQSDPLYADVMLICPEGQSIGLPAEFDPPATLPANRRHTFVPASVSTREPDIIIDGDVENAMPGPVPDNGTCVVENNVFTADFGNRFAKNLSNYNGDPLKVLWRKRQLNGNGTLGSWSNLTQTGYAAEPYDGTHVHITAKNRGIFQMQAVLVLPNGTEIEYPFVRMRNARSIQDSSSPPQINNLLKAGAEDYFGVAHNFQSKILRDTAVAWLGSTSYSYDSHVQSLPLDIFSVDFYRKDKCTLFLTHISNSCGATTPYFYLKKIVPYPPIARDDWYGEPELHVDLDIPGWGYKGQFGELCPGRMVAGYGSGGHTNGHVGIIDYDGSWIGAGPKNVNKFIHFINMDPHYKPFAIRARN